MAYTYVPDQKPSLGVLGDNALLIAIGISAVISIILGGQFAQPWAAVVGTLVLLGVTGIGYAMARGSLMSRLILSAVLVNFVTLHIHLSRGMPEFHFGMFVTLALLLVYRDWRPICWAALGFVVYQFGIDRLQAAGHAVYCLERPNAWRVLLHALFITVQAGAEVILATSMAALGAAGDELSMLVARVDQPDGIALDVAEVATRTPEGSALKMTLSKMASAVAVLRAGTDRMNSACHEIATGNVDLSMRTEETAANLQRTAASMVALTQTTHQADANATTADRLAQTARSVAQEGGEVIAEVMDTMKGISDSSSKIADIIGLIDGIAYQTNLLALNAAVEAARAGEQGRGFAVVAGEVRTLAGRSVEAANEIRQLIGNSVERVGHGSALVDRAGATMQQIVDSVQRVTEIMGSLSTSSRQQATEVAQIGEALSQMDRATQQNAAMVEQMAAAAGSLKTQADELVQTVAVFAVRQPAA